MNPTPPAPILSFPELPFYTGLLDPARAYDLPASLPFALGIEPRYAIPRLILTPPLRAAIDAAYSMGSMCSTPLGESSLASGRMGEFKKRLEVVLGGVAGKRLLEVGCGNGELLHQLQLAGAIVTGLEIGPQADVVESRYGIRVIREPLTPGSVTERFDCILSYGCLEHIEDLEGFLAASRECLVDGGLFFHSVPNSALAFDRVWLEHLQHEHVNYFTPANATALLEAQGFGRASHALTPAGNELMVWGFRRSGPTAWPEHRLPEETQQLQRYAELLPAKVEKTLGNLRALLQRGLTIGLYAGGYPYGFFLQPSAIRYFDGDTYKHGKRWLQGLPVIEPPEALRSSPPDRIIVAKPHYFEPISRAIRQLGVDAARIVDLDALGQ